LQQSPADAAGDLPEFAAPTGLMDPPSLPSTADSTATEDATGRDGTLLVLVMNAGGERESTTLLVTGWAR
jgi:hypothetical protein